MRYSAYHAKITAQAFLTDEDGTTTQRAFLPQERFTTTYSNNVFRAEWQIYVPKACGHVLEAEFAYEVWWQALGGGGMEIRLGQAKRYGQANDRQSSCECDGNTELQNNEFDSGYDPYSDGGPVCGAGPGEGEGGTQYEAGDFTDGETVDWETGMGNGGVSQCGQAAQVDYVCIEFYNATTQEWEVWDCGYITTC